MQHYPAEECVTFTCLRNPGEWKADSADGLYVSDDQLQRSLETINVWTWGQFADQVSESLGFRIRAALSPDEQSIRQALTRRDIRPSIGPQPIPAIVHDVVLALASSGITAGLFQLLKTWVDARNGRKLKIKVGDI